MAQETLPRARPEQPVLALRLSLPDPQKNTWLELRAELRKNESHCCGAGVLTMTPQAWASHHWVVTPFLLRAAENEPAQTCRNQQLSCFSRPKLQNWHQVLRTAQMISLLQCVTFMWHSNSERNQHDQMDEWKNELLHGDLKEIFSHAWEGKERISDQNRTKQLETADVWWKERYFLGWEI